MSEQYVAALDVGSSRDPSVLCLRQGNVITEFVKFTDPDVLRTASLVDQALRARGFRPRPTSAAVPWDVPSDMVGGPSGWDDGLGESSQLKALVCDVVGLGDGPARWLAAQGWPVYRFHSSGKPRDKKKFLNARAECHWRLREALERGSLQIVRNEALAEELLACQWGTDQADRIFIERKLGLKKRLGRSPDFLDSASMTYATERRCSGGGTMLSF